MQGSYPFSETNFQDFPMQGLFQDSHWFFQDCKIHINPFTPKISMLILLTICHTFYNFYLSLTDFHNFPGPVIFFQHFPVLENATTKFQSWLSRFSRTRMNPVNGNHHRLDNEWHFQKECLKWKNVNQFFYTI